MSTRLMLLPSKSFEQIRLLRIPDDFEDHEAYRLATGVIAEVELNIPGCSWEDVWDALEEHGFEKLDFVLGPALD